MEFMLMATIRPSVTPEQRRELIRVFSKWHPPEGVTLNSLYMATDERHSFGLYEADSAAAIGEIPITLGDYLEFDVYPVMPVEEGAALFSKAQGWVDQAKSA